MKKKILLWSLLLCILGGAFSVTYAIARRVATASLIDYPSSTTGITVGGTCAFGDVKIKTNSISVSGIKFANSYQNSGTLNANYVTLDVGGGFMAGDIVTIAGAYNSDNSKNAKIDIFTLDASNNYTVLFTTQQFVNGKTSNDEPVEENYVVAEDVDKLYLGRNGNVTTFVTKLSVTRAEDWNVASGQYQLMGGSWTDIPTTEPAKVAFVGNDVYLRLTVSGINVSIKGEMSGNTVTFPKNQTVALSAEMALYLMGTTDGTTASDIIFEYDSEANTLSQAGTIVASTLESNAAKAMVVLQGIVVQNPAGPMSEESDVLTLSTLGVSGTSYVDVTGKKATSKAIYAGNLAGGNNAIQLRTKESNSGIVTTASGGTVKSIKIEWNSNTADARTLVVYGKTSPYETAADLYDTSKQGALIASFTKSDGDKTTEITGNYQFVGFRSNKDPMYIDKITIVWEAPSSSEVATTVTIDDSSINNTDVYAGTAAGSLSAVVKAGDTPIDGASVTWTSSEESVATITSNGAVTLVAAGTTTITASYAGVEGQYQASSATYELTVVNNDPNVPGTEGNPYTVAQARAAIDAGTGVTGVYATGIVSKIVTPYNSTYGNISYNISADGLTTSDQLQAYRGKGLKGANFTSADDIQVGDVVVIYGNLTKYNTTYEFGEGNQLVSLVRKVDPEISYTTTEYDVTIDETSSFVAPTLNNPYNLTVTYSSNNEAIALVDENTGDVVLADQVGEATITATFAGNDTYKAGSASYTITITNPNAKGTKANPYTVAEVINGTATGTGIYVQGYIVGEYVGNTTNPKTTGFVGNSNLAIADEFTKSPTASGSVPIQLPSGSSLQTAWGLKVNNGAYLGYKVLVKGDVDTYFSVKGIKNTTEIEAISVLATVTNAGWATWIAPLTVKVPSTVKAYYVKVNGNKTSLTEKSVIPAGIPVLLQGEGVHEFTVTDVVPNEAIDNDLLISGAGEEPQNPYVLAKPAGKPIGFYKWTDTAALPTGKVYIEHTTSTTSTAPDFISLGDDATGIEDAAKSEEMRDKSYYNLNGQRVAQPAKGLYIVNGKKVIIK